MKHLTRAWAGVVLWAWFASAQMVPDRYVVELTQPPLGAAVRTKGKDALSDPHRAILTEQARVRRAIESQRGRVTASVDSLMNALLVTLPGQSPSVLASIPGVKKVYPVQEVHLHLDRALGLHRVPTAWTLLGGKDQAGAGLKIAILDTGVSPDHPGFQDSSLPFPPGFPRGSSEQNLKLTNHKIIVARSYEDIYRLTEPDDANDRVGHGTAVAMCAAGVTNTGPRATITGVAPKAWIGSYKVFPLKRNASSDAILKALDDALSDGMDVINMSFGNLFQDTGPDALYSVALDRLKNFGVMVVVSVGNHGSALNSLTNISTLPSVISVGAMRNDRVFSDSLTVAGETYLAQAGTGPRPLSAVKGAVFDVEAIDPTGLLCARAAAGSLTGKVALVFRGVCSFEDKLNHAEAGGAIAAIFYTDAARPDAITPAVDAATLPAVMVSYANGLAIKKAAQGATVNATLPFQQNAFARDFRRVAPFSSSGPTPDFRIKPDLIAAGTDIYTAAQSLDEQGDAYSKDGYQILEGTSFASPIVAGAAAVLRGARPGLTVDQYNSLLLNGAKLLMVDGGPQVESVQRVGSGMLNLESALRNTLTVFPTSLTFEIGTGALAGAFRRLEVTNIGNATDTVRIRSMPLDLAPALQFAAEPGSRAPDAVHELILQPGQTKTVYAYWTAQLPGGEYQGHILLEGTSTALLTPYWYGVPTLVPDAVLEINPPKATATPATTVTLYVRVMDSIGYPLTTDAQIRFTGTATAGATIDLVPGVVLPNLRAIRMRLATAARANTFQFTFGNLPPVTHTITGTNAAP